MPPGGSDKDKAAKLRNSASKTPQSLTTLKSNKATGKHGSNMNNGNANSSSRLFVSDITQLCMHCAKIIEKDDKGMQCNFCDLYIHNECDGNIPDELYDVNNKYPDNSLIYLCPKCRPIIPPSKDQVISGIIGKVESMLDEKSDRPKLSDQILETLSDRVRDMDRMVVDHSKTMSELNSDMSSLRGEFKQIVQAMREMTKQVPAEPTNNPHDQPTTAAGTQTDYDRVIEQPRNFGPRFQNFPHQPVFPNQHANRGLQNDLAPIHDQTFPTLYQAQAQNWRPPPIPRPDQYSINRVPYPPPPNHAGHNSQNPSKPDPDTTLVVYNTNRNININLVVERLELLCKVYPNEVTNSTRLPGPPNKNPPITISCINAKIKWLFVKSINQLRSNAATADEFKSVFARPYLTEEGLRNDRALVRELNYIRSKYPEKTYKIYKNEIHEHINNEYVKLHDTTTEHTHRERTDSISSNRQYMTPQSSSRRSTFSQSEEIPSLESSTDQVNLIQSALEEAGSDDTRSPPAVTTPVTRNPATTDTSRNSS